MSKEHFELNSNKWITMINERNQGRVIDWADQNLTRNCASILWLWDPLLNALLSFLAMSLWNILKYYKTWTTFWASYITKGMSYIRSVRSGVLVRETLVLSHPLCEEGWPVPFLAAFISPEFPPGTHLLLGGQWVGNQPLALCGSRTVVFATVSKRPNRYATRPLLYNYVYQVLSFL